MSAGRSISAEDFDALVVHLRPQVSGSMRCTAGDEIDQRVRRLFDRAGDALAERPPVGV
jgi:hypothetical protein